MMMKRHYCLSPADRAVAGSGSAVLESYMALRLRYVTDMGWLPGISSDHDLYDGLAETRYFVRIDHPPVDVSAGMRATRVASLYDSLTWSMLDSTPGTRQAVSAANELLMARLGRCASDESRGLWDITRLVAPLNGPVSKAEIVQSIYELFGMALYATAIGPQADPVWVLLTTRSVKRLLDMSAMQCTTIFSGRVTPTDDYDCYLCVVRPRSLVSLPGHSSGGPARLRSRCCCADGAPLVSQVRRSHQNQRGTPVGSAQTARNCIDSSIAVIPSF